MHRQGGIHSLSRLYLREFILNLRHSSFLLCIGRQFSWAKNGLAHDDAMLPSMVVYRSYPLDYGTQKIISELTDCHSINEFSAASSIYSSLTKSYLFRCSYNRNNLSLKRIARKQISFQCFTFREKLRTPSVLFDVNHHVHLFGIRCWFYLFSDCVRSHVNVVVSTGAFVHFEKPHPLKGWPIAPLSSSLH